MNRWMVTTSVLVLVVAIVGLGSGATSGTAAQSSDDDDLAATVEVLQTRVTELEERVDDLEAAADGDEDQTAVSESADETSTSSEDGTDEASDEEDAPLGTRRNPIPLDATFDVGDYSVRVVEVVLNAANLVLAENQFNDPPAEGRQFLIVTVEVTYRGDDVGMPAVDLNPQLVGNRSTIYTTFNDSCGVVPNDAFLIGELGPGGLVRYNLCWSVVSGEVESLILFFEPFFDFNADPVYFALRATD